VVVRILSSHERSLISLAVLRIGKEFSNFLINGFIKIAKSLPTSLYKREGNWGLPLWKRGILIPFCGIFSQIFPLFHTLALLIDSLVGLDDVLNEWMSDHVFVREVDKFDPFYSF